MNHDIKRAAIISTLLQANRYAALGNNNQAVAALEAATKNFPDEPVLPLRIIDRVRQINLSELEQIRLLRLPYQVKAERCRASNQKFRQAASGPTLQIATLAGTMTKPAFILDEIEKKRFTYFVDDFALRGWIDLWAPMARAMDHYFPAPPISQANYG